MSKGIINLVQYRTMFGSWYTPMKDIIDKYITVKFLTETIYSKQMSPTANLIFNAFRSCNYHETKVIIIGQDPYVDKNKATGLCFSNPESTIDISPSLGLIWGQVEKNLSGNKIRVDFDVTLQEWARQGVLLLNSSLTVDSGRRNSHFVHWYPFLSSIIKRLSNNKKDLVFILLGRVANNYRKHIDEKKHLVMDFEHPSSVIRNNKSWDMNGFTRTNRYLTKHGKTKIKW